MHRAVLSLCCKSFILFSLRREKGNFFGTHSILAQFYLLAQLIFHFFPDFQISREVVLVVCTTVIFHNRSFEISMKKKRRSTIQHYTRIDSLNFIFLNSFGNRQKKQKRRQVNVRFRFGTACYMNIRELKGKLSWAAHAFKWSRLWQHARFSGHVSFTESAGGFALHRCRLESNLKSSGCLFQVKLLMTFSL